LGRHIGAQHFTQLANNGGVLHNTDHTQLDEGHINLKIRQAYKLYQCLKERKVDTRCGLGNSFRPKHKTRRSQRNLYGKNCSTEKICNNA